MTGSWKAFVTISMMIQLYEWISLSGAVVCYIYTSGIHPSQSWFFVLALASGISLESFLRGLLCWWPFHTDAGII